MLLGKKGDLNPADLSYKIKPIRFVVLENMSLHLLPVLTVLHTSSVA